jgi:hypothetical protein
MPDDIPTSPPPCILAFTDSTIRRHSLLFIQSSLSAYKIQAACAVDRILHLGAIWQGCTRRLQLAVYPGCAVGCLTALGRHRLARPVALNSFVSSICRDMTSEDACEQQKGRQIRPLSLGDELHEALFPRYTIDKLERTYRENCSTDVSLVLGV